MHQASNKIRTRIPTSILIFLLADIVLCGGLIVYGALVNTELLIIRILIFVMCGIFFAVGLIQLLAETLNFIVVSEEGVVINKWLVRTKLSFDKISYVENKDDQYNIFVKQRKFYTFSSRAKKASEIIAFLECHGVEIKW